MTCCKHYQQLSIQHVCPMHISWLILPPVLPLLSSGVFDWFTRWKHILTANTFLLRPWSSRHLRNGGTSDTPAGSCTWRAWSAWGGGRCRCLNKAKQLLTLVMTCCKHYQHLPVQHVCPMHISWPILPPVWFLLSSDVFDWFTRWKHILTDNTFLLRPWNSRHLRNGGTSDTPGGSCTWRAWSAWGGGRCRCLNKAKQLLTLVMTCCKHYQHLPVQHVCPMHISWPILPPVWFLLSSGVFHWFTRWKHILTANTFLLRPWNSRHLRNGGTSDTPAGSCTWRAWSAWGGGRCRCLNKAKQLLTLVMTCCKHYQHLPIQHVCPMHISWPILPPVWFLLSSDVFDWFTQWMITHLNC